MKNTYPAIFYSLKCKCMSDVLFGNEKLRKYENVNNITLYAKGMGMSQVQCFLGIQNTTFSH